MDEKEAFAPRQPLAAGLDSGTLYSATPWPPGQQMCMHHELSYRLEFPGLLLFACLTPAASGGGTALADAASVLKALPADLVQRFEREGWILDRAYSEDFGASCEEAFGTGDRAAIEGYCRAAGFRGYLEQQPGAGRITVYEDAGQLIRSSDLLVFATVAGKPHVSDPSWFKHNPLVLHVSLRDLAPEILLASANVVDDVEHCLKADTSPHLAERLTGNREFLAGTLDDVTSGRVTVPGDRPVVFSPFGLGVLDLAVGKYVYDEVSRAGQLHVIDGFFHELSRYGS
jgi:hypothetical protein